MTRIARHERSVSRWAVVLAGGEGIRLRSLTERIGGAGCPKQFCRLFGDKTPYEQTEERLSPSFPPERQIVVVTRAQERFFPPVLHAKSPSQRIMQPENRGTAAAILYALMRLEALDPAAEVAIFPSDHHVSDNRRFMGFVQSAFQSLALCPEQIVILGIEATAAETQYGWIEAEPRTRPFDAGVARVKRFWEKPSAAIALRLWRRGCLWNSFVFAARASSLLELIQREAPELCGHFSRLRPFLGSELEEIAARQVYRDIQQTDFSQQVLANAGERLSVLRVSNVSWTDLGDPVRVAALLEGAFRPHPELESCLNGANHKAEVA